MLTYNAVAIITPGRKSPGHSTLIETIVGRALNDGVAQRVIGYKAGWEGVLKREYIQFGRNINGISRQLSQMEPSNTFLNPFTDAAITERFLSHLKADYVDALVIIGGEGSLQGAFTLSAFGIPVVGVPLSYKNNVRSTDYSIGFDTATQSYLQNIDHARNAAHSDKTCRVIETLGEGTGYLALYSGAYGRAGITLIPEHAVSMHRVADTISRKKGSIDLIVVAEGTKIWDHHDNAVPLRRGAAGKYVCDSLNESAGKAFGNPGYLVCEPAPSEDFIRGLGPSAFDVNMARAFGAEAVNLLMGGEHEHMVSFSNGTVHAKTLSQLLTEPPRRVSVPLFYDTINFTAAKTPDLAFSPT